jgi:hypothetical protein
MITRLGRADELEVVRGVYEYYNDIMVINEDFFHLGIEKPLCIANNAKQSVLPNSRAETAQVFNRNISGLCSLFLSMKKTPSEVRYTAASGITKQIAEGVVSTIERDDIFQFPRSTGPLVLILDRADDPVTPLLTQWTYQAMVHELLGLNNNRVLLKDNPNVSKDMQEVSTPFLVSPFPPFPPFIYVLNVVNDGTNIDILSCTSNPESSLLTYMSSLYPLVSHISTMNTLYIYRWYSRVLKMLSSKTIAMIILVTWVKLSKCCLMIIRKRRR